jgi:hypothetical protein
MAFIFSDPNSAGPFAGFQQKDIRCKVFKLTNANFATTNVDTFVGALPSAAALTSIKVWVKTALAGNSVSSPVISVGTASGGTQFANAFAVTNTSSTITSVTTITGLYAAYNVPYTTGDIQIWIRGGCSTGNPTSGEVYVQVDYVT